MTAPTTTPTIPPPRDGLCVRRATLSDRAAVLAIAGAAMRSVGLEPEFDGLDRDLGQFGAPACDRAAHLVAEWRGQVIGSLILSAKDARTLKLSGFYVDPRCRGQGAGRMLLQGAIGHARALDGSAIYLETWDKMNAAVHLYQAFGWRRHQRLPASHGAEWSYLLDLDTVPQSP